MGDWEYTLTVHWDSGSGPGLQYIDIFLDQFNDYRGCTCEELKTGFRTSPGDTVGFSESGPNRNTVYYTSEYLCLGDPNAILIPGTMLKFYPFDGQESTPGTKGVGTFSIFSDFEPVPMDEPNLLLVNEDDCVCFGEIYGQLPGLPCDPVPGEEASWGSIKALYK
jgi:hypothetical protein